MDGLKGTDLPIVERFPTEFAIYLKRSGDHAVVSLLLDDGREIEIIRELADNNFSHIVEPLGISTAIEAARKQG
jgi:hypothetical protein